MSDDVDSAAHAAHDAYVNAINSNDVDALLGTVTDDIVYLPPNSPAIVGTHDVRRWLAEYFAAFQSKWVKTSVEFVVRGSRVALRKALDPDLADARAADAVFAPEWLSAKDEEAWRDL